MNPKPSKSEKKRKAQAARSLAERLLTLSAAELDGLPLSKELRDTLRATRNIRRRGALRRQRLYLAGMLRRTEPAPLNLALAALDRQQAGERRLFHQAERWRDRLLSEGTGALPEFCERTGRENPRLTELVRSLQPGIPEPLCRGKARAIFREVHADLAFAVHMQAGNL